MGNFVMDIVMEPIRFESVEVLQYEIEERIKSWLKKNNIDYKNLKVNMYTTRLSIMAEIYTNAEFMKENIISFFVNIREGDVTYEDTSDISFYRPILNILAIFDDQIIPIEIMGVKSENKNLINFKNYIEINSYDEYVEKMKNYIYESSDECFDKMSSSLKRRAISIGKKLAIAAERVKGLSYIDSKLSVIDAEFEDKYLELPIPIIETVLHNHKNIFATYYEDGKISNSFLIVFREDMGKNNLKSSHVNMINAELKAITKLFNKDLEEKLEDYLPRLKWISNIELLGSMLDKTERVQKIVEKTADELMFAEEMNENLKKASELMKADLGTRTINRYPSLKGVVGGEMLKIEDEKTGIADSIREQYLPDFNGKMPQTIGGSVLAIADRIHDLAGLEILSNLNYRHSWTLRKFDDIVKIMIEMEPELNFENIIENTLYSYTENSIGAFDYKIVFDKLFKMLKDRFKYQLHKNDIKSYLIEDVFIERDTSINNLFRKLKDLSEIEDVDLILFIRKIIDYKKKIKNAEITEGHATSIEARIGDILNYANSKSTEAVSFIKIIYEYKDEFYELINSYNEGEITNAAKLLANNFREMWL